MRNCEGKLRGWARGCPRCLHRRFCQPLSPALVLGRQRSKAVNIKWQKGEKERGEKTNKTTQPSHTVSPWVEEETPREALLLERGSDGPGGLGPGAPTWCPRTVGPGQGAPEAFWEGRRYRVGAELVLPAPRLCPDGVLWVWDGGAWGLLVRPEAPHGA